MLTTTIGVFASILTTASYLPQLKKAWCSRETDDLSLHMLVCLAFGIGLWVTYGLRQADWVIVASNSVSLVLLLAIVVLKIRGDHRSG